MNLSQSSVVERQPLVVLVDDNEPLLRALLRALRSARPGVRFEPASSGAAARELAREERVDVLLTDLDMPDESGLELLQWFADERPNVIRVVHSSRLDDATALLAQHVVAKPAMPLAIAVLLDEVLPHRRKAAVSG